MVVRVLIATVPADRAGQFHDVMRQQLPILRASEGLEYVKLARRVDGATEEVILYEEWRDTAALYAVGSSRVDLQACKLEYSIVSPK